MAEQHLVILKILEKKRKKKVIGLVTPTLGSFYDYWVNVNV